MAEKPYIELPSDPGYDRRADDREGDRARGIYERIWAKFSVDRKKSRSTAYRNLQRALSMHAADLVPNYLTAKEHMSMIAEIEDWTKNEKESDTGDPSELMAQWLRGQTELSRIPLETVRKS
jgi:translation elongation factor EF-Ts